MCSTQRCNSHDRAPRSLSPAEGAGPSRTGSNCFRWGGWERGQDLIEYALTLPMLIVLILAIMEGGVLVMRYNTVANAAREGARSGLLPATAACDLACRDGQATAAARALTEGLDQTVLQVNVSSNNALVRVEVRYQSRLMSAPLMTLVGAADTLELRSVATMQRE